MMQLEKIKFLKGAKDIQEIPFGYSGAFKYSFMKRRKKYFLKIGTFPIDPHLETILDNHYINHPKIIEVGKYDSTYHYIIEEFIEGDDLKTLMKKKDAKYLYEYGFRIGEQYRNLRKTYPDKKVTEEAFNQYNTMINSRTDALENLLKGKTWVSDTHRLFLQNLISHMRKNKEKIRNSVLIFGHTDIKPSNFLYCDKEIIATDIEHTDYKELSLSMRWSYARYEQNDEKNFAFTRGYLDALFQFNIPESILEAFNYTYLYGMENYFIYALEANDEKKLTEIIDHLSLYKIQDKICISTSLQPTLQIEKFPLLKNGEFTLARGSFNPCNVTFKCETKEKKYFLKRVQMSEQHFKKSLASYQLLEECGIPTSPLRDAGCILPNQVYYMLFDYIDMQEMDECISSTFRKGFKSGKMVASYLKPLKIKTLENTSTYDKDTLVSAMLQEVGTVFGNSDESPLIYWTKEEIMQYIEKYSSAFDEEPIHLIHGDVKFDNILYNGKKICFVDNESLMYSYDSINFLYNIQNGFEDENNPRYKGFVNGYLTYMNDGAIPKRIQNQAKLLLIYYILRIMRNIKENTSEISRITCLLNSCHTYIDEDRDIKWLK